ncbi:hemagglutinin repeat-containing protein [Sinorhizobium meliloti]|uniref:hemagglutinin repeat-containing protein n=1 Tax=Rhizobium meliloti TaxID=382 RepID=UPI0004095B52|nr:hemagglutinin repeat-containing protein [Sinorhizobium meliloti]
MVLRSGHRKVTGVAPQDGTGAAPALAVDVSALGGMYADAIQMIATERGVGVRIDGEMASGSSLSLSSAGRLSLGSSSGVGLKARQKVIVRSDGPLLLEGSVTSEQGDLVDIRTGGALTFTGQASGGNILLESAGAANVAAAVAARGKLTLRSTGSSLAVGADAALSARSAVLTAGGNLTLKGSLDAGGAAELAAGETLEAGAGAKVSAGSLRLGGTAVATAGLLKAAGALAVTAGSGGLANNGELSGESVAIASTGNASNSGAILAARDLRIESLDSIDNSGSLAGASATFVATRDTANSGTIAAAGALDISAGLRLSATAGSKISGGTVALSGGTVETAGTIVANAALTLEAAAGGLSNRGTVQAATTGIRSAAALLNEGQIGGRDEVAIAAAADLGNEGVISSLGTVRLQSGATMALGKNSETSGGNVALSAAALHSAGTVVADAALTIAAGGGGIGNSGLLAGETVNATAKGQLANSGAISGRSAVSLGAAASLLVSGSITSEGTIGLSAEQTLSTMAAAEIAGQSVALTGGSVRSAGTVVAAAALEIVSASGGIVNSGTLVGARAVAGTGGSFRNEGAVAGSTELLIAATDIHNSGVLSSNGLVLLKAARSVVTDDGSRVAGGAVDVSGESLATAGVILAETTLRLASGSGGTASSATISASTAELVSTGEVGNAGVVEGIDKVVIDAAAVTNDGTLLSRGRVGIDADRTVATGRGSGIQAGAVAIDAASVATAGTIVADRTLEIVADSGGIGNSGTLIGGSARFETTAAFRNDGRIVGAQDLFAAAENITNSGVLAGDGAIRLNAGKTLTTTADARIDGGAVDLAAERILSAGTTLADTGLNVSAGTGGLLNSGSLVSSSTTLASGAAIDNQGNIEGTSALTIAAATAFAATANSSIRAGDAAISADAVDIAGKLAATGLLAVNAGSGGLKSSGTLSGGSIDLVSAGTFANTGLVSGGDTLTIAAAAPFINAAALVSGRDLAIYNDQILNNGGVIWANGSITLAANAALDPADVVQNTDGRIEALQGDLTIRANEVYNVGTAPTIGSSQIIKWLEKGSAGTTEPAEEILKLIDPAYLDADGNIKPSHAGAYAALWADLVSGGSLLSATSRSIVKPSVTTPSGTALAAAFAGIWSDMLARANAAGTPDPAAAIKELVSDTAFASNGDILPQNAAAYAALWDTLASGGTTVTDDVKAILKPTSLEVEGTGTDPATGETATVYSNRLVAAATSPWNAMTAGSGAAYDIVKILYQDRFQDDGVLAELVAGGSIDIKAGKVENIYGNISAAENIVITADDVKNQALGASQFLVEVHKRPDCFTCHEGKVEFYDTFGGRIEANGTVAISGNLENITLPSSELSTKDVLDKLNAYIAERQAAGDPDMAGVPPASDKNFELTETRTDDYTAPVAGNGSEVRKVEGTDLGSETKVDTGPPAKFDPLSPIAVNRYGPVVVDPLAPVAVDRPAPASVALPGTPTVIPVDTAVLSEKLQPVVPLRPSLSPTASVDALLVAGLTTLAETDPEFTQYANFVTSDYLMSEGRLAYRDDLVNNGRETILAALKRAGERVPVPAFDYLDKPVQVPAPDGSGSRTVYPKAVPLSLDATGALIQGRDVAIASGSLTSSGTIAGSRSLTVSAGTVSVDSGRLIAESGALTLSALDAASFENATISGGSVALVTGGELLAAGTSIVSAGDLSIYGNAGVTLTGLERSFAGTWANGTFETVDQQLSTLQSGGDLAIVSGGALTLAGVTGDAAGALSLAAAGDLVLSAVESTTAFQRSGRRSSLDISTVASSGTKLNAGGDLSALAGGSAVLVGTALDSGGSIRLAAKDEVVLAAAQDIYSYDAKTQKKSLFKKKSTSVSKARVTNEGVSIAAAGDVDVVAETGDFVTAGSRFVSAGGDIDLSATEGDIYAGAYTDIFQESRTTKKSYFFGLFGSTTNSSAESRFSTGTDALAALDLTLVSGADTTLVGAHLAAGGNLSVDTGGDFKVEAAIDSERKGFFSNNLGLVTMTTITERSFRETAKLSSFEAGGAMDFSIGGQASLSLYNQAGVDPANPGDLYPEELLAIAGLAFIEAGLANEYFYDKQVALSPAFKALVAVAVANFVAPAIVGTVLPGLSGWAVAAAEAFTSSFIVESLDGIVSGNYDIGEILKGAAFSGATAGLKDAVNLSALGIDTEGLLNESLLGGFGNGQLTLGGILDGALDGAIGSGLTSLVYGTDFGSGFSQALLSTVVNLALADVQGGIGDLGLGEGTLPSALLHGLAGCAAAEAQGGNCAAGAAGAVAQSLFAGSLNGTVSVDSELALKQAGSRGARRVYLLRRQG